MKTYRIGWLPGDGVGKEVMEATKIVLDRVGFKGSLDEFFRFLNTDPRFVWPNREALVAGYVDIMNRVDPQLPKLFDVLPKAAYEVRDGNYDQAMDALRYVRAANRARDSESIAEIVAEELGSSDESEDDEMEAEEGAAEEADAILEEPASAIVPFSGTRHRLGD